VEFNKIAILEKFGFGSKQASSFSMINQNPFGAGNGDFLLDDDPQLFEVQQCMSRLMRQTLL
jgi:hypothetical protein